MYRQKLALAFGKEGCQLGALLAQPLLGTIWIDLWMNLIQEWTNIWRLSAQIQGNVRALLSCKILLWSMKCFNKSQGCICAAVQDSLNALKKISWHFLDPGNLAQNMKHSAHNNIMCSLAIIISGQFCLSQLIIITIGFMKSFFWKKG